MLLSTFSLLIAVVAGPLTVSACEGPCITGVADAWISNYTHPVADVMAVLADEIATQLIPIRPRNIDPLAYLYPILYAHKRQSSPAMQTAIFPKFFHGKCLVKGKKPKGCPNPDCPVVCGTPGSLVHFYDKLRGIVFTQTQMYLKDQLAPTSEVYKTIERVVLRDAKRSIRAGPPPPPLPPPPHRYYSRLFARVFGSRPLTPPPPYESEFDEDARIKKTLADILAKTGPLLQSRCNGTGKGGIVGLDDCSWEKEMKAFILTYP